MGGHTGPDTMVELKGLPIVINHFTDGTGRLAAGELGRYLYLLTGEHCPALGAMPKKGHALVLDVDARLGEQGYRLAVKKRGQWLNVVIAGGSSVGALYGVYRLLEHLGMGFYNGGDTFPDLPAAASLPVDFADSAEPAFPVRGNMLHYNFLCGPTNWGLADYKFYFDQLARQRMNLLLMHWYDSEPGAAYEVDGEYLAGGPTPNSLSKPWGAIEALRTSQFSFGTGRCFDEEVWTSPAGDDLPDTITEIKQTEAIFRVATHYARRRGIRMAAGFEAPSGQMAPTDPTVREHFLARLEQFLGRNPDLTYFALWQHESGGCTGTKPPAKGTAAYELYARQRDQFVALGNERRIWEAIRFGEFARMAAEYLASHAPHLRLVVVGWGGDRWMRFADYCLIYDKLLPKSVIFTCHDNIDASMGPNVSTPWGQLPAERERWAMPWVEGDVEDCWTRQPHVESLGLLAPDALAKGCQGLLNLQWRTRDVEEENGYIAQFAWQPGLTPEAFYRRFARQAFGAKHEARLAEIIGTLQKLGGHWDGVRGCGECSRMRWTGWEPHFPFELDPAAIAWLVPFAEKASTVLATIPPEDEDPQAGAFHLRQELAEGATTDERRLGAKEMAAIAVRLRTLSAKKGEKVWRDGLWAIHEDAYALRYELVTAGMVGAGYMAMDVFLFALHHLLRVAGYRSKSATLRAIRDELATLRQALTAESATARLERLDFLTATIDFVLGYGAVATRLADGERLDRALAAAREAGGDTCARIAAEAYEELVGAGMREALLAYTGKLTTRCDWGTLATLNVKLMPLYWQAIAKLEELLPAPPPREVRVRGQADEAWISWQTAPRAVSHHVYRRPAQGGTWTRLTKSPVNGRCCMAVDRPAPGAYAYAVTAIDAAGVEGPRSHAATATVGPLADGPRILAAKPYGQAFGGEPYQQRVVVLADRELESVALVYRPAGETEWWSVPMHHRFRDSYQGIITDEDMLPGIMEFFVQAIDIDGREACWPATAPALPWSLTVTDYEPGD